MASLPVPLDVPCPYCHLSYTDMNTFNQHINFHLKRIEERADFPCGYCEKRLLSAFGLEHHVRNKHPDVTIQWSTSLNPEYELTTELKKSPPASHSPQASPTSEDENKDDQSESDESDSDSDISESSEIDDAEWSSPATPWVELVVIGDHKMYSCIICQKRSPKLSRLQEHVRLHTGERPYECFVCQDKIRRSQSFKQHFQRFHSNFRVDMKLEHVTFKLNQNTVQPTPLQSQVQESPPHSNEEGHLLAQSTTATKSLPAQSLHTELESENLDGNLGENLQEGQGCFGDGNRSFRDEDAYDPDVVQLLADMGVDEEEISSGSGSQLSVPKCMLSPTEEPLVNARIVSTLSITANDLHESLNLMKINNPPSEPMMSYSLTPPQSPSNSRNTINSQTNHGDLNKYITRSRNYSTSSPRYVCPDCYIGCVDLDEYFKHTAACEVVQSSLPQLSIMDRIARENNPKPTESLVIIDDKMPDVAEPSSGQIESAVTVESPHPTNIPVKTAAQSITYPPCSSSSEPEKTQPGPSATTVTPQFSASLPKSPVSIAPPPNNTPSPTETLAKSVTPQTQPSPCRPSIIISDSPKSGSDITSPKQLGRHRKPRGLLPCRHCPRWYDNPSALRTHMYATHGEALFQLEAEIEERHATLFPLQSTLTAIVNPFSHLRLDSAQEPGSTSPRETQGTHDFQMPSLSHPQTCKAVDNLEIVSPTRKIETHPISKIQEPHPAQTRSQQQLQSLSVPCQPTREEARAPDQQPNNSAPRQLSPQQGPVPASDNQGAENKRVTRRTMLPTPTPTIDYQQRLRKRKVELKEEGPIPCKYCKRNIPQWKMEKHEKMHVEKQINQNQVKKMALKRKLSQIFEWDGRNSTGPGNQYTETRYTLEYASVCPTNLEVWTSLSPRTVNKALATLLKK